MRKKTWLQAAGIAGLGAASIFLLAHGYRESGTMAFALAMACLVCRLLWSWKL